VDSYLLEGLQSADKTKMHLKAKLENTPIFTHTGSHSHVCLKIKTFTYQLYKQQLFVYTSLWMAIHWTQRNCVYCNGCRRWMVFVSITCLFLCCRTSVRWWCPIQNYSRITTR